jgi:hypothetical protein
MTIEMGLECLSIQWYHCSDRVVATDEMVVATVAFRAVATMLFCSSATSLSSPCQDQDHFPDILRLVDPCSFHHRSYYLLTFRRLLNNHYRKH